ncbi:hypothetical protein Acr_00g0100480 [Actinidia rufa]|uniref:UBN2_3 domain-containing protein n=1 Tax=Actinidia rufa TaxID=165716 RepID=A0A7J0DZV2_9ERIC|nr:hypothetical protein Acr_00g0100480 [Actinidia rufa]
MSWLLHSMIPEIGEGFLALDTAKDVWDTVFKTYSRQGNIAQVYDLQQSVERLDQAELISLQYYSALTTLWQRLDYLTDYTHVCPTDKQRVFKFLASLQDEYDQVMMLPPIPSEQLALVYVPQSERRNLPTHRDSGSSIDSDDKDKLHCDYCQRPRHTRKTCWRLHSRSSTRGRGGRLGSVGGRGGNSRAHHSTVVEPPPSDSEFRALSTFEIELIRRVMSRLDISAGASSSFAHSSNFVRSGSSNEDDD